LRVNEIIIIVSTHAAINFVASHFFRKIKRSSIKETLLLTFIASNVGGLKQIIVDQKTGFLVKPGDVGDLAEKIEILLDNSNLRNTMGLKAREIAQEKYNWSDIVKKYYLPLFTP